MKLKIQILQSIKTRLSFKHNINYIMNYDVNLFCEKLKAIVDKDIVKSLFYFV